jgi:hypothetical protein
MANLVHRRLTGVFTVYNLWLQCLVRFVVRWVRTACPKLQRQGDVVGLDSRVNLPNRRLQGVWLRAAPVRNPCR